jgi:uncharacterized protein YjbI with pentapeptide repeats
MRNRLSDFVSQKVRDAIGADGFRSFSYAGETWPSLWSCLYGFERKTADSLGPVVILDQFDELLGSEKYAELDAFIREVRHIVQNRPPEEIVKAAEKKLFKLQASESIEREDLISLAKGETSIPARFVISVREDFLPGIERLGQRMPGILRAAFRVRPFLSDEAQDALIRTLEYWNRKHSTNKFELEPAAVHTVLAFLKAAPEDAMIPTFTEHEPDQYINPAQFQILLYGLYQDAILAGRNKISDLELKRPAALDNVLKAYYSRVLSRFPWLRFGPNASGWRAPSRSNWLLVNSPRFSVARFCETGLVLADKVMNTIAILVAGKEYGLDQRNIDELVEARLVVRESRAGGEFIELAHQVLLPMLSNARRRRERISWWVGVLAILCILFVLETFWRPDVEVAKYALSEGESTIALRYLRWRETQLDLSGVKFPDGTRAFQNLQLIAPNFSNAILNASQFGQFVAEQASFTSARMANSVLTDDDFAKAAFDQTDLTSAKFQDTDLSKANFTKATLEGASFINSNLYNTNFSNVLASGLPSRKVDMTGSNWWMSIGWSPEDQEVFWNKYKADAFKLTKAYTQLLTLRCLDVRLAADPKQEARALNDLAWYIIVSGGGTKGVADLIKAARNLAGHAATQGDQQGNINNMQPSLQNQIDETDAELKLRRGRYSDALRLYQSIGDIAAQRPDWRFREQLAAASGSTSGAVSPLDGFQPSYELVLFTSNHTTSEPDDVLLDERLQLDQVCGKP